MNPAPPVIHPSSDAFAAHYAHGLPQLVWTTRPADLDTPVSALLRLKEADMPCFLLESVERGEARGRYSVIGLEPDLIWRCWGDKAEICRSERMDGAFTPCPEPSLEAFRRLLAESALDIPEELPPMASGLVGYFSYDTVRLMEKLPGRHPDTLGIPDGCFVRPRLMVIFDSVADRVFIVAPIWADGRQGGDAAAAYGAATQRLKRVIARLEQPVSHAHRQATPVDTGSFVSNTGRDEYEVMIRRAKEHIAAGDIFQVVLSQRFRAPFPLPPFSLYRALRHLNPSPFLFYLDFVDFQMVGSSPEILVRLQGGKVTIRPIAGTRKRGHSKAEDKALAEDLLADPKELAEHLMLLDLGRNDVGRVARTGSVRTTQRMAIENYSHVMHIVSNVEGELDPRHDAIDALIGGFPAGTVSGAPKIRAMEIIDALERERRGFYAGCVGYFSSSGDMDTCITLRTGLVKDGTLYIQAGGGIVADSDSEAEYQESLNKAKALMRAAEEAAKFV